VSFLAEGSPVVLGSANPKKAAELVEILGSRIEVVPRPLEIPEIIEDADTFEGNARLKALAISEATSMAALADDSGLMVDALDGQPGVHSARYSGENATDSDNVSKLLAELVEAGAMSSAQRRARFHSVIVLRRPDGAEVVAKGTVEGTISLVPTGEGGFGYDPVFVPLEGDGRTFGEMTAAEKHAMSHRGRALEELVAQL